MKPLHLEFLDKKTYTCVYHDWVNHLKGAGYNACHNRKIASLSPYFVNCDIWTMLFLEARVRSSYDVVCGIPVVYSSLVLCNVVVVTVWDVPRADFWDEDDRTCSLSLLGDPLCGRGITCATAEWRMV